MVMDEDLTLGGGHTIQYSENISQNCTLETYNLDILIKI